MQKPKKSLRTVLPTEWISELAPAAAQLEVGSVSSDSRSVNPGTLFVAVRGGTQDGHRFIDQAVKDGAVAVIGEDPAPQGLSTPYVQVPDSREALAQLASTFYDHPSRKMLMVGVTGTSGKTTTTYLIESILKAAGHRVALVGTVQFRFDGKVRESTHTTPGAVELQEMLADWRSQGCTAVVMEVSSHALKQHRVGGIAFDAMVFTNLTREHLDFHPDMEDYFRSKAMLFTEYAAESMRAGKKAFAVINADDEYGKKLITELRASSSVDLRQILTFGSQAGVELPSTGLKVDLSGVQGTVRGIRIQSPMTGQFSISNILAAAGVGIGLGIPPESLATGISNLKSVPGRLQPVENSHGIHILVDYAHKPDALEKVLQTLKAVKGPNRLITVFGCGGDRDRTKRPVMGKLAVENSDRVFVTSDNPRTEDPQAIIEEILAGVKGHANFVVEPDRKKAIVAAIGEARTGDIVLIAGKGHEDYQIVGSQKVHFDDREVAAEALLLRKL